MRDQLFFADHCTFLQCDEALGPLAPFIVRHGDHRAFQNGGMANDGLLDFNR